jgi:acylphosphatase
MPSDSREAALLAEAVRDVQGEYREIPPHDLTDLSDFMAYGTMNSMNFGMLYGGEEDGGRPDADFMEMLFEQKGAQMAGMDPERDRIREHIIFHGRVQGVGFRYQAMYAARSFDLTGWVQNLPDGSVEMEVQGTPAGIGRMMKHLRSGHWIRIDDMDMEEIGTVPGERGFSVRGY